MEYEDDDSKKYDRHHDGKRNPWDPVSRTQVKFAMPRSVDVRRRINDDFGVRNDTFHACEMRLIRRRRIERRADEEILDIVIRASETKEGVRREERLVCRLRELRNYEIFKYNSKLGLRRNG